MIGVTTDLSVFVACVIWRGLDAGETCAVGNGFMHPNRTRIKTHGARMCGMVIVRRRMRGDPPRDCAHCSACCVCVMGAFPSSINQTGRSSLDACVVCEHASVDICHKLHVRDMPVRFAVRNTQRCALGSSSMKEELSGRAHMVGT